MKKRTVFTQEEKDYIYGCMMGTPYPDWEEGTKMNNLHDRVCSKVKEWSK